MKMTLLLLLSFVPFNALSLLGQNPTFSPQLTKSFFSTLTIQQHSLPQVDVVSLQQIFEDRDRFHEQLISIKGTVSQPELHVDTTSLFIDFVFVLKEGSHSIIVFGKHDRTQGDIQIQLGRQVMVRGVFWKERLALGMVLKNQMEATTVEFSPTLSPNQA